MAHPAALTADLGAFVASFERAAVPAAIARQVRRGLLDSIGTMIAGAASDSARIVREVAADGGAEASVLLGPQRAGAAAAALINGTAAHALDYDDVALQGHFSAVLMPAILAEAEALGLPGAMVTPAYVVGYEVWAELIGREVQPVHRKGWHPTGVLGAVGAAAACAYLHGLDARRAAHALAIAASQGAGLVANFGSMTKPFHAGRAAQAGLLAARLARAGFTGAADALEGRNGLLAAIALGDALDLAPPVRAGTHFERHGLTFKKFPTCLSTHRPAEAMLQLRRQGAIAPAAVAGIAVSLSRRNAEILHVHRPRTALEAKFCLEFAVSATLSRGSLGLADLSADAIADPDIRGLMAKVEIIMDDREDPATGYAPYDEVSIRLAGGGELSRRIDATPGSPASPLSDRDLRDKFDDCLRHAGTRLDADRLFDALMAIDTLADMRQLAQSP